MTNPKAKLPPVVLAVAGSDSSGGAGIQADLRAISANGGYGATAITALTAQNTTGVTGVVAAPAAFVVEQMMAVFDDLSVSAIKTGMLGDSELIEAVSHCLRERTEIPTVIDPVMVATSGAVLLADSAITALKCQLLPLATLLTPNRHEARVLTGITVDSVQDAERAAKALVELGVGAALVKGGHGEDPNWAVDVLWDGRELTHWRYSRLQTKHTHGTGCTLSSAIAAQLGRGRPLVQAVSQARAYLQGAIANGLDLGKGHGPTDHFWWLDREQNFVAKMPQSS
ncbi:MAG TPA: bifunctional hydroxymethylpyrimidine kinase/phosphomethylpyrimidine kinase [Myxococcales bacterium]|mgnify:CR=1 FL=1|nr:bifunctional hydroxymethylpyrimidine kinase/phosphomethylpyrimidine kinase [Myxococcales bacterium]HAN31900.1 bifunctional hydroxymethylpyrimidine kinase/phosphomethylpyrimidine kinase [Myxococcales bacterium]